MQSIDSDTEIGLSLALRSKDPKPNSAGPSQTLPATRPEVPPGGFGSDGRETERSHGKKMSWRCNGIQMGSLERTEKWADTGGIYRIGDGLSWFCLIGYLIGKIGSDVYENQRMWVE